MRHNWSNPFVSDFKWNSHIDDANRLATVGSGSGNSAPPSLQFLMPRIFSQPDQPVVFDDLDGSGSEVDEVLGDDVQLADTLNSVALDESDSEAESITPNSLIQLIIKPNQPVRLSSQYETYI